MTKLGETIAWSINRIFPPLGIHRDLGNAKKSVAGNQHWAYLEAKRIIPWFYPFWDLNGKSILDIGVGLGGKLPSYVESGASQISGIDIDFNSIQIAKESISSPKNNMPGNPQVRLLVSDASKLPFANGCFDVIVSINTFEHIEFIEEALFETYRVLRQGGLIFLHFPPYYSPWGPHLENWLHFPWPHLFFSERTLMKVVAREDAVYHYNNQFVNGAKINLKNALDKIPDVNRITLNKFLKLIKKTQFAVRQRRWLPVGYEYFDKHQNLFYRFGYLLLRVAANIPGLQEVVVTKMVYVLQK